MVLPIYNSEAPLEEVLEQFDCSTSRLVLLPRGKANIRNHVFDAATDAALASSRCIVAFEKKHNHGSLSAVLAGRFLKDICECCIALDRLNDLYVNFKEIEYDVQEIEKLRYEKSIIESYISLMELRAQYIRNMLSQIRKP